MTDVDKAVRALRTLAACTRPGGPTRQAATLGLAAIEDLRTRLAAAEALAYIGEERAHRRSGLTTIPTRRSFGDHPNRRREEGR